MYVYRVATKAELGPYQGGVCDYRHYDDAHPGPAEDGIPVDLQYSQSYNYGFKSKGQLLNWFSKSDLRRFEQKDFYVWRYSVPKSAVSFGQRQVAFDLQKSTERKRVARKEFDAIRTEPVSVNNEQQMAFSAFWNMLRAWSVKL